MLIYIKIPSSLPTFSKLVFIKHSYVHFQDAERGVSNFWKELQGAITVVQIIKLCKLIHVLKKNFFLLCTVHFAVIQECWFYFEIYLP